MTDLIFLRPLWLIGAAVCMVALYMLFRASSSKSGWWDLMDAQMARSLIAKKGSNKFLTPVNTLLMLIAVMCVALAGPSVDRQVPDELKGKASIIVLLANSDSMYAGDVTPNRNRVAKQKIKTLTDKMPGSQLGMIAYANSAHQVSPLTSDPNFLSLYLSDLEPKLMPDREQKYNGLQDAFNEANKMMKHARYPVNILILADQLDAMNVSDILSFREKNKIDIEVLAMGTEKGGTLRFVADKDVPDNVMTQMNLSQFAALKEQGVAMLGVTQNDDDIDWLASQIKQSVKQVNDLNPEFNLRDSGYFLAWFFIPLCLPLFRKQSWLFSVFPMFITLSFMNTTTAHAITWDEIWWTADQQGQMAIEKGDYKLAASVFEDAYLKGRALYQLAEYKLAEIEFRQVDSANGYFYLANTLAMQEKYKEALRYYGKAVEVKGHFTEADSNVELVKSKLAKANKVSANQRLVEDQGQIMLQVGGKGNVKKKQHFNIDPLNYSEEELNTWLSKVKSSPEKLLKTKFELQSQEKMLDDL